MVANEDSDETDVLKSRPETCGLVLWKCVTAARFAKAGIRVRPCLPEWKATPVFAVMSVMRVFLRVFEGVDMLQRGSTDRSSSFYHIFGHDTLVMPNRPTRPTRPRRTLDLLKAIVDLMAQRIAWRLVNDEGIRLDIAVSGRLPGVAIPGDISVAEIGFSRPSRV